MRADTYDTMRVNWFNNLTANANAYWSILQATRPFTTTPFSDISYGSDSDNHTVVYSRLETTARAYWAVGGSLYGNATLKADLLSPLDWLNTNAYNASTKSYGNWFAWNIGVPLTLNNTVVLLYNSLSVTQIANYMGAINHFTPTPTTVSTSGANCAWCASIVGLRGVIVKNSAKVETIIENRRLNAAGDNAFTVGGATQPTTKPWTSTQNAVPWLHLVGSVAGADLGYYFPGGANLDFTREARTSSWSTVGVGSSASVTDNYLNVGDSHGVNPAGRSYAYVLLPNYTAAQTAAYAAAPVATVLENDAYISAVRDAKLGASGAVFWQNGSQRVTTGATPGFFTSDKK